MHESEESEARELGKPDYFNLTKDPMSQISSTYNDFDARVYEICRRIPSGHVTTYGRIARLIEAPPEIDPLAYDRIKARWVGYAMSRCPEDVPWHRVITSRGKISRGLGLGMDHQRALLEGEGIQVDVDGSIDIERYLWEPN